MTRPSLVPTRDLGGPVPSGIHKPMAEVDIDEERSAVDSASPGR